MFLTPTVASMLSASQIPSLTTLTLAGEPILQHHLDNWAGFSGTLQICYGPAECSIHCTWRTAFADDARTSDAEPSNIGHALASWLWVVDPLDHNQLMPVGAVGELIIEGPLVARGYLKDQKASEAAFIDAPKWVHGPRTRRRFYKSGDLVKFNPDGSLSFISRKGREIKIHGQRVELSGLEHHLLVKLEHLTFVAVEAVDRSDLTRGQTLAVFLCFKNQGTELEDPGCPHPLLASVTDTTLSSMKHADKILAELLPLHISAFAYLPLKYMPLTVSGKIDRHKLRQLVEEISEHDMRLYSLAEKAKRLPKTRMEKRLRRFWAEALGVTVTAVGADDNLFHLGGDSITAMRLVSIASEEDIPITVAMIFQNPRLSELAAILATSSEVEHFQAAASIVHRPFELLTDVDSLEMIKQEVKNQCSTTVGAIQDMYPCTPLQEGLFVLSAQHPGAYTSQNVFRLPADMARDLDRFQTAWGVVVQSTEILRTRIVQTQAHGFFQIVLDEPIVWHSAVQLNAYLEEDRHQPMLMGQPLSRFATIVTTTDEIFFVWTAHHAAYDGWSLSLVMQKLQQAYHIGATTPSPPFCSFIKYITRIDKGAATNFWQSITAGIRAPSFPRLPSRRYRPHVDSSVMQSFPLRRVVGSEITPSTLLSASWAIVIGTYTGADDVVLGITMNGRTAPVKDITDMIGPTITTVPFVVKISQNMTIFDFLKAVQEQASQMIHYQHTGLREIKSMLPEGAVDFQTLLVVQPQNESSATVLGMEAIEVLNQDFHTYPCVVECSLSKSGVDVQIRFDSNVLTTAQTNAILDHLGHVLQQLQADSDYRRLSDINKFTPADREQVFGWNAEDPKEVNACIYDLFEEQVQARPEALAVNAFDGVLTYSELDKVGDFRSTICPEWILGPSGPACKR